MRSALLASCSLILCSMLAAQEPPREREGGRGEPPAAGPGGPGGPMGRAERKLREQFDGDRNGWLDRKERDAAREWLAAQPQPQRGRGPGGGPGAGPGPDGGPGGRAAGPGGGRGRATPTPGPRMAPGDVTAGGKAPFYAPDTLRTLFFTFEHADWESELETFYNTDVEVSTGLEVDGVVLKGVGVKFRGNSSYFMTGKGSKRSLGVSIDLQDPKQELLSYQTLNLLNCADDPTLMREALHAWLARKFVAVPQANLVRVVINGECWGIYANVQQINKDYLQENFGTRKGHRWKVPANPRGGGGLRFLGDELAPYQRAYEAKGDVPVEAWQRIVHASRLLADATDEQLQSELPAALDVDSALWFMAFDNVLLDGDGYLSRASDFALYLSPDDVLHLLPYDSNEILRAGGGPGMRGPGGPGGAGAPPDGAPREGAPPGEPGQRGRGGRGPGGMMGGGSPDQGPLARIDDPDRPLLRMLKVPAWRARYLAFARSLALELDWQRLGPQMERWRELIGDAVAADTRKLYPTEQFDAGITALREICERRRKAILGDAAMQGDWPSVEVTAARAVRDGGRVRLAAVANTDAKVVQAWLCVQQKRPGAFVRVPMNAKDGGWSATSAAFDEGEKLHFYVEAQDQQGRVAFWPAGASRAAVAITLQ